MNAPPAAPPPERVAFRHLYGLEADIPLSRVQVEQAAFLIRLPTEKGGLGRYRHFKNFARLIWPDVEWNPWLCDQIRELCSDDSAVVSGDVYIKTVAMTGAAAAGKSFSAGFFAVGWWRCSPMDSAVIVCSTQKDMLKKRVWDPISNFHVTAIDPQTKKFHQVGRLIDSRTKIVWEDSLRSDEKHGIFGLAVAGGETIKAVQEIKGIHANRVMVIVDEAEATPEAIFEAIPNLRKGCREFILVVLGNSVSRMDPHGIICAPKLGWNSVSVDSESWPTKGVPRWQIEPGTCLHFDGTKSPNVLARRTLHPYLYSWEDFLAASNKPDYAQSRAFWQHDRGFWAPEGLADTIFTESMIEKYDGPEFKFESFSTPIAFLDPAFGGDDCKMLFGTLGNIISGRLAVQITHNITIPISATSKDEIDYQVARRAVAECKKRNVQPRQFGVDAVGTGRGVAAIIAAEWSSEIQRVETTGAPTERPSSTADGRPAKEVYDRLATEFWWSAREILQGGQVRGFYRELIVQLCARTYALKGRKYAIETKEDFKARIKRSPDDADCFSAGTLVLTPQGNRPIETLKIGDMVTTPFGDSPIEKIHVRGVNEITTAEFSDGSCLQGKGKHKIFTWEDGWVRLDELSLTHTIESALNLPIWQSLNRLCIKDTRTTFKALVDIIKTETKLSRNAFYTGPSGENIMARFQRECLSIIRMVTGQTIDPRISNSWHPEIIKDFISQRFGKRIQNIEQLSFAILKCFERKLRHGTLPMLAGNGTLNTARTFGEIEFQSQRIAEFAEKSTRQKTKENREHAQGNASNEPRGRNRERFSSLENVLSALKIIGRSKNIEIVIAPIAVRQSRLPESRPVYNLTLAEHNAHYANGILVDNCMVGILEVARRNGLAPATGIAKRKDSDWSKMLAEADKLHDDPPLHADSVGDPDEEYEYAV